MGMSKREAMTASTAKIARALRQFEIDSSFAQA
jgi:hypothetical protein